MGAAPSPASTEPDLMATQNGKLSGPESATDTSSGSVAGGSARHLGVGTGRARRGGGRGLLQLSTLVFLGMATACTPSDEADRRPPDRPPGSLRAEPDHRRDEDGTPEHPGPGVSGRLEIRTRIGLDASHPHGSFAQITALAVDRLGRVYVADGLSREVKVFDSLGVHVRTLGRGGAGPGEFTFPAGLAWESDSRLWIRDAASSRYSVYDTAGNHLLDRRRPPIGSYPGWPARFHDGRLIEAHVGGGYRLIALDPEAPDRGAVAEYPFPLEGVPLEDWNPSFLVRSENTVWRTAIPFTEGYEWSLDYGGGIWIGDTREYRLVRRSLDGDTLLVTSYTATLPSVSDEDLRRALEELGPMTRELDPSEVPRRKPAFRRLIPREEGGVWLLREGEGSTWYVDVLDSDGRLRASYTLPVDPDLRVQPVLGPGGLHLAVRGLMDLPLVVRLSPGPNFELP